NISFENVSASVISSSARSGSDASRALMRDFQEDISADDGAAISSPSMVAVMASPFGGRCGQMEGWSVGAVLAGGAAGRGSVDDRAGAGAGESGERQARRPLPPPLL